MSVCVSRTHACMYVVTYGYRRAYMYILPIPVRV